MFGRVDLLCSITCVYLPFYICSTLAQHRCNTTRANSKNSVWFDEFFKWKFCFLIHFLLIGIGLTRTTTRMVLIYRNMARHWSVLIQKIIEKNRKYEFRLALPSTWINVSPFFQLSVDKSFSRMPNRYNTLRYCEKTASLTFTEQVYNCQAF